MKHMFSKGGIVLVALSLMLSLAPKSIALIPNPQPTQKNVMVYGTYSYDLPNTTGGFTARTGSFTLDFRPEYINGLVDSHGYDFYNQTIVRRGQDNAISLGVGNYMGFQNYYGPDNGKPILCTPNMHNGLYQLTNQYDALPDISTGQYSRSCVIANQNSAYAFYDQTHNLYVRVMITKIEYFNSPFSDSTNYPTEYATVLQPTGDNVIQREQGNLTISWTPRNTAVSYSLHLQCELNSSSNTWKDTVGVITGTSYNYNLANIPSGDHNCHIFISSVTATGERYGYPVRNFLLRSPNTLTITSPDNYKRVNPTKYGVVIMWNDLSANHTYYGDIVCLDCKKPWTRTFSSRGLFYNIRNLLKQLPNKNHLVKISLRTENGLEAEPLYLTVTK